MHELSICQGLMRQVTAIAQQHHARSVSLIRLRIGPLSGVEPELLMQAFPIASAGTVAANATLTVERQAVRVRCRQCGAETEATANRLVCGECGHWQTQLVSGDEMILQSVELETGSLAGES